MIAPEKLLNDKNVWAQQWDALRRIVLEMLELIYSARCYLFVFDLTGSFVIFISEYYGFVFKQLPHSTQINKWKVATTMRATYTPAHTPENYNNDNNTNKASVAVIWMVVELMNYGKKRKEKYVHVSHSDCPHKLLFLCEFEILQIHWLNIHRNTGLFRFEQGEKGKQSQIHNEHGSISVTASIFLFGFCFIAKVFFRGSYSKK